MLLSPPLLWLTDRERHPPELGYHLAGPFYNAQQDEFYVLDPPTKKPIGDGMALSYEVVRA